MPQLDGFVTGVEHTFLAREYVEGRSLLDLALERNPLVNPGSTLTREQYVEWVVEQVAAVRSIVEQMHAAGYVFGDLHPANVIVDASGRAHVIDLESASTDVDGYVQSMGVFGFRAPADRRGKSVDVFALGCMRLALLVPLTRVAAYGPAMARALRDHVTEEFSLPDDYLKPLSDELGWDLDDLPPAEDLTEGVTGGALQRVLRTYRTPDRPDRLFPGDIRQLLDRGAGATFAYGAAGAVWALRACRAPVDPADVAWIREAVARTPDLPVGFWTGLAGVAHALRGVDDALADEALPRAVVLAVGTTDPTMRRGLSGLGLVLLAEQQARPTADGAARLDAVGQRLLATVRPARESLGAGLGAGAAGVALFALRLSAHTGDPALRHLATDLLGDELTRFGLTEGAAVPPGALPAFGAGLDHGVLGVGLLLAEYRRVAGDEPALAAAQRRVTGIACTSVALNGGVLTGRAGVLQYLLAVDDGTPAVAAAVERTRRRLGLALQAVGEEVLSLGEGSLKLSLDYATGHAGMASTLEAYRRRRPLLPLLADDR